MKMYRIILDWLWSLDSQKYLIYTKLTPQSPKFWGPFCSTSEQSFSRHKVAQNQKQIGDTPNNLKMTLNS